MLPPASRRKRRVARRSRARKAAPGYRREADLRHQLKPALLPPTERAGRVTPGAVAHELRAGWATMLPLGTLAQAVLPVPPVC